MEQFLIDTNCVSGFLSGSIPLPGMEFMSSVIDDVPNISIITQIELQCWNTKDKQTIRAILSFIDDSTIININQAIVSTCTTIRKGRKMKTPDAIIAATALVMGFSLLTNNEKDFVKIPKLRVINPYKMM